MAGDLVASYNGEIVYVELDLTPTYPGKSDYCYSVSIPLTYRPAINLATGEPYRDVNGDPIMWIDERLNISSGWCGSTKVAWERFAQKCAEHGVTLHGNTIDLLHINS